MHHNYHLFLRCILLYSSYSLSSIRSPRISVPTPSHPNEDKDSLWKAPRPPAPAALQVSPSSQEHTCKSRYWGSGQARPCWSWMMKATWQCPGHNGLKALREALVSKSKQEREQSYSLSEDKRTSHSLSVINNSFIWPDEQCLQLYAKQKHWDALTSLLTSTNIRGQHSVYCLQQIINIETFRLPTHLNSAIISPLL